MVDFKLLSIIEGMITPPQKDDYPYLADWFAISLRWLVLLGITSSLLLAGNLNWMVIYILLFSVTWNFISSMLAMVNRRIPAHRLVNVVVDILTTALFFYFGGGLSGPLAWISLMALFTAAIYYEWRGSLTVAVILSLSQAAFIYFLSQPNPYLIQLLLVLTAFNLGGGLLFGLLSRQLMIAVRRNYQNLISKRQQNERRVQRRERERMESILRMIETLSASLDYQTVIETALDLCTEAMGISPAEQEGLVRAALLYSEHDLLVHSGRGLTPSDNRQSFPAENGVLKEVLQNAKAKMINSPAQDAELGRLMALHNCRVALLLPLHRGLNAYGVMLFAHPDEHFFNADRCEILEVLSHQAVVSIQNARLYQDIAMEKERIVETQEEARKKLARDLHDGPTQTVSAIAMRIAIARRLLSEGQTQEGYEELARLEELARRTTQEIRTMLFTLRPLVLESEGLESALEAMAVKMRDTYQQKVVVDVSSEAITLLEINKQSVVFSLAEEAVNNARKHAKASEIRVRLRFAGKDKTIGLLEVSDDGVGFDPQAVQTDYERRGSFGMVNLSERTDLLNGVLHIDSAPGKGTCVQVAIPFTQEAADRLQRLR